MIIVSATLHPQGDASRAYELLHATIDNRSEADDTRQRYFAHILSRPSARLGIEGYEADIEVTGHVPGDGFPPILMAVLNAAHHSDGRGCIIPPARQLARLTLHEVITFERAIKDRP